MKSRIISAVIMIALLVPLLIVGGVPFAIFMTILSTLALYEIIHVRETERKFPIIVKIFAYLLVMFFTISNFNSIQFVVNVDYRVISFIILLSMFIFKKSIITLSPKYITKEMWVYKDVLKVGFPSLCRQGLASIATIFLNNQAGAFGGDAALDAMSIVSKIFMIVFSASLGIGQGYQPVCGYNYFAKRYDRVKEAMMFTLIWGAVLMFLTCTVLFIFAEPIMKAFVSNGGETIAIGTRVIRYQSLTMPFLSLNVIANMSFQSTKKKISATILSL